LDIKSGSRRISTERHHFLVQHADIQRNRQSFVQIAFPQTSDTTYDVPDLNELSWLWRYYEQRDDRNLLLVYQVRFVRPTHFPNMPVCPKRIRRRNVSRKSSTSLWTNTLSGRNWDSHICTPVCCRTPVWNNNYAFIGMISNNNVLNRSVFRVGGWVGGFSGNSRAPGEWRPTERYNIHVRTKYNK